MPARRLLIAANWKMNPTPAGFDAPNSPYRAQKMIDVVVFPSFLELQQCVDAKLMTGAQYGHPEEQGAHTGDIGMRMIAETGATFVLCGHSERRREHGETDQMVLAQAKAALGAGLHPIVCVGETQQERDSGQAKSVVERQLQGLPSGVTIAYEPVWAIGTGKNATADEAQEMHAFIRSLLPAKDRNATRILYGGSMNAQNAEELLRCPDIDGGLVGGASLKPADFGRIVEIAISAAV